MNNPLNNAGFELDKRVPVALIVTLVVQTAGLGFWLGQISTRLTTVEITLADDAENAERLARVEAQSESMKAQLARIEAILERQR